MKVVSGSELLQSPKGNSKFPHAQSPNQQDLTE